MISFMGLEVVVFDNFMHVFKILLTFIFYYTPEIPSSELFLIKLTSATSIFYKHSLLAETRYPHLSLLDL